MASSPSVTEDPNDPNYVPSEVSGQDEDSQDSEMTRQDTENERQVGDNLNTHTRKSQRVRHMPNKLKDYVCDIPNP